MNNRKNLFEQLPAVALDPRKFEILYSAKQFRAFLIKSIRNARRKIYIAALYLEADEAGRNILTELYEAKKKSPELDIIVCVDWHRAQRGPIGEKHATANNISMYQEFAVKYEHKIVVNGIPVRGREVFGVLHLKGFIIDDHVIYSGASLNNLYLHYNDRYRFDRYHVLENKALSDSMSHYMKNILIAHSAVNSLNEPNQLTMKSLKPVIKKFRRLLSGSKYQFTPEEVARDRIAVTPMVGLGRKSNHLNQSILYLIAQAKKEIYICTPYFNLSKRVSREVKRALKRGVKLKMIVGDKTASDFFIPKDKAFRTIGGLPYLYEVNLRRFAKVNESRIISGQLSIYLWKHDLNSFHLKGIWADQRHILLTGNNLNPRAWRLDLENGLLIQDRDGLLGEKLKNEFSHILKHTRLVCTYKQLQQMKDYPLAAQRFIKRICLTKADRVLSQIL